MMNDIINAWQISNRINLYLLDAIPEEYLKDVSASKGRNVGEQFAHLHQVRLMWLKVSAPDLYEQQRKIEKEGITKAGLKQVLTESSIAMGTLLERGFAAGKIKGFKPDPAAFFGYFTAHEAHHRGQIMLSLKQSGHAVDKKVQYGMWEWGSR